MAHTCPDCGQVCHCRGDVDDIQLDGYEEQMNCRHHLRCEAEDDADEDPSDGRDEDFDGSAEERTPSLDAQRRDALGR